MSVLTLELEILTNNKNNSIGRDGDPLWNKCLNTDGAYREGRSPREKGGEAMSRTEEEWRGRSYKWAWGAGGCWSWRLEKMLRGSSMGGIKLTAEAEWNKQTIAVKRTSGKGGRRRRRVWRRVKGVDTMPPPVWRGAGRLLFSSSASVIMHVGAGLSGSRSCDSGWLSSSSENLGD